MSFSTLSFAQTKTSSDAEPRMLARSKLAMHAPEASEILRLSAWLFALRFGNVRNLHSLRPAGLPVGHIGLTVNQGWEARAGGGAVGKGIKRKELPPLVVYVKHNGAVRKVEFADPRKAFLEEFQRLCQPHGMVAAVSPFPKQRA